MNATQQLHGLGQSLWHDNMTRVLLSSGTLERYNRDFATIMATEYPAILPTIVKHQRTNAGQAP